MIIIVTILTIPTIVLIYIYTHITIWLLLYILPLWLLLLLWSLYYYYYCIIYYDYYYDDYYYYILLLWLLVLFIITIIYVYIRTHYDGFSHLHFSEKTKKRLAGHRQHGCQALIPRKLSQRGSRRKGCHQKKSRWTPYNWWHPTYHVYIYIEQGVDYV